MHAALIIVAQLISNVTPEPVATQPPRPTQIVLDGCNTASAIRAAEIRLMPPAHPTTRLLLVELLREKDGATCLLESNVLVDLHSARIHGDLIARALAKGLASPPHVAERAKEVIGEIGANDPVGFGKLLRRLEVARAAGRVVNASVR